MKLLTKTLFTMGLQCHKFLYLSINSTEKLGEDSLGTQFRKEQGMLVGELAKRLYPEGLDLAKLPDEIKLEETEKNKNKVIFEASALFENLFARADILVPQKDGSYHIIEVKSSSKIKPEHIPDVSFQRHVFEKAGYNISKCFIAHTNSEYIKDGNIDVKNLFIIEEIETPNITDGIKSINSILDLNSTPDISISKNCLNPFECPLKKECWSFLGKNNVTQLYYDKKTGFELITKGIFNIKDMPDIELTGSRKRERGIQILATKNNEIYFEKENVSKFIKSFEYPIMYFDFETYSPAIPIFNNSRPWQRIPFQFSLHIEHKDGSIEHKEFLGTENKDPRKELINAMEEYLGDKGSIVVYNQGFEKSVIRELMRDFPEFKDAGNNFIARIVDLADPFRKFQYYNPEQQGRYSIKVILPLFSKLSYKGMSINNGEDAFCAFEKIIKNTNKTKEKEQLIKDLKEYCKLDTLAELEIVRGLRKMG